MANNLDALLARAKSIRQDILKMTTEAGSGHPSSSLSAIEIVTALYFGGFLRHDPKNPHWPDRDRFILSKGHAAPVLYAALAQAGYFPHDEIMTLRKLGSPLEGHPNMKRLAGVEASTGSLGQGLSIGIGHALAARIDKKSYHTYVLTGDGELDEGQNWEAAASAAKFELDNLTLIVDRNHLPADRPRRGGAQPRPDRRQVHRLRLEDPGHQRQRPARGPARRSSGLAPSRASPPASSRSTHKGQGILNLLRKLGDTNFHGKPVPAKYLDEALAEVAAGGE